MTQAWWRRRDARGVDPVTLRTRCWRGSIASPVRGVAQRAAVLGGNSRTRCRCQRQASTKSIAARTRRLSRWSECVRRATNATYTFKNALVQEAAHESRSSERAAAQGRVVDGCGSGSERVESETEVVARHAERRRTTRRSPSMSGRRAAKRRSAHETRFDICAPPSPLQAFRNGHARARDARCRCARSRDRSRTRLGTRKGRAWAVRSSSRECREKIARAASTKVRFEIAEATSALQSKCHALDRDRRRPRPRELLGSALHPGPRG